MEEVTAGVYLVSISRSRCSAVYGGGHAKTALLRAAISAAAHQICEMLTNVHFRFYRDERSELVRGTRTKFSIKAVLSDDEGMEQKAYRNPVCTMPGCTGEDH